MIRQARVRMRREIDDLEYELRVAIPDAIRAAQELGDLAENGDYHAAIERRQFVEARLSMLNTRMSELEELEGMEHVEGTVGIGCRVRLRDLDSGAEECISIVPADLADFDRGEVSPGSPIGQALLGLGIGATADVILPGRSRRLEVLAIAAAVILDGERVLPDEDALNSPPKKAAGKRQKATAAAAARPAVQAAPAAPKASPAPRTTKSSAKVASTKGEKKPRKKPVAARPAAAKTVAAPVDAPVQLDLLALL